MKKKVIALVVGAVLAVGGLLAYIFGWNKINNELEF